MQLHTVYFILKLLHMFRVVFAPDDGWRNHPKYVEQFKYKINCL